MSEKIQKIQPDLVQSVLEAQEKKNTERVDILITNALKQLKMSRFKPDQATCLSLIYLARISPKTFSHSATLRELLKTHLRRDNGPSNIKAPIKNDFIIPVLAANILLACSDCPEVRAIILKRIEQWLNSNQKITENVQHLLALLCIRCQGDEPTVQALIDMRHHWFQCLDVSHGNVAIDLCDGVRKLLHSDNKCESLIENLSFLLKHDKDTIGLANNVSRLILERPISLKNMLENTKHGSRLEELLLLIFNKLFEELSILTKKAETINSPLFLKIPKTDQTVVIEQATFEALLFLLSMIAHTSGETKQENKQLNSWLSDFQSGAILYTDPDMTEIYNLPIQLRQRLIHSESETLVDFGLKQATTVQLLDLIQQFGLEESTIRKILVTLNEVKTDELRLSELRDPAHLNNILEYLADFGIEEASVFRSKLDGADAKKTTGLGDVKIKVEA